MKSKNELFLEAVDYLIDEGLAKDSSDVAQKAGLGPNLISRVRNGRVKSVSDDSIRTLAFKFNLNMDFFRGKSEHISSYDQSSANLDRDLKEAQRLLDKDPLAPSPKPSDSSELIIAAKDETIAALRTQLEEKDVTIQSLRQQLAQFRQMKETMDDTFSSVESIKGQMEMLLSIYGTPHASDLFPTTVANDEPDDLHTFKFVKGKNGKQDLIAVIPQGLIRGGRPAITDELIKKAAELLSHPNRKK